MGGEIYLLKAPLTSQFHYTHIPMGQLTGGGEDGEGGFNLSPGHHILNYLKGGEDTTPPPPSHPTSPLTSRRDDGGVNGHKLAEKEKRGRGNKGWLIDKSWGWGKIDRMIK